MKGLKARRARREGWSKRRGPDVSRRDVLTVPVQRRHVVETADSEASAHPYVTMESLLWERNTSDWQWLRRRRHHH